MCSTRIIRELLVYSIITSLLLLACSATAPRLPTDDLISIGTWGGVGGGLIVGDTSAHLHVGCTYGDVSGRISVNSSGRFDVPGSYMLRAYPVARGPAVPARFAGQVDGSTITVTALVDDTVTHQTTSRGPVTLTFGTEPRLGSCPICRRPLVTRLGRTFPSRLHEMLIGAFDR